MKIVLANGCFDILHAGHVRHLKEARTHGDHLVVALTIDEAVNKGPGRPVNTWRDRADVLLALRVVDHVIPSSSARQAIQAIRPDVFCKGIDYLDSPKLEPDREACARLGIELIITRSPKMSATEIIRRAK